MIRSVILFLAAAMSVAATAAAPSIDDLRGTWVWEVEGRNLLVLNLDKGPTGLSGTLNRPKEMAFGMAGAGLAVSRIRMPPISTPVEYVRATSDGHVLRFTDTGGNIIEFSLRPDGAGGALFGFSATASAAPVAHLNRPRDPVALATDWEPDKTYLARAPSEPSNAEMAAIYAADQADRQAGQKTDWAVVAPRDAARRVRVRKMLDEGLIRTADDFHQAAFVFQHGEAPADYLLAHVLAMAAQSKGRADAGWIAVATLDRYLQNIGQPQITGTQFRNGTSGKVTQGEYDAALLPDTVRRALGVPTRAEQEAQMRAWEEASR